jgi:hypothetical protein
MKSHAIKLFAWWRVFKLVRWLGKKTNQQVNTLEAETFIELA